VGGASSTHWGENKGVQDLGGQPEGRRHFGRTRRRGKVIKMGLKGSRLGRWTGFSWHGTGTSGGLL